MFNVGSSGFMYFNGAVVNPGQNTAFTVKLTKTAGTPDTVSITVYTDSTYNYQVGAEVYNNNGVKIFKLVNIFGFMYSNVDYFNGNTVVLGETLEYTIPNYDSNATYSLIGDNKSIATLDTETGKITVDTSKLSGNMYGKRTLSLGYCKVFSFTGNENITGIGSNGTTTGVTVNENSAITNKYIYVSGNTNSYDISVTVGGETLASANYTVNWYSWGEYYNLTVPAEYVTGDIVITATAK